MILMIILNQIVESLRCCWTVSMNSMILSQPLMWYPCCWAITQMQSQQSFLTAKAHFMHSMSAFWSFPFASAACWQYLKAKIKNQVPLGNSFWQSLSLDDGQVASENATAKNNATIKINFIICDCVINY